MSSLPLRERWPAACLIYSALLLAVAVQGCGGSSGDVVRGHPSGAAGARGSSALIGIGGHGPSTSPDGSSGGSTTTGSNCASAQFDGCTGEVFEGEALALDIYIMFDQSGSMASDVGGLTRLQAVQGAVAAFLTDPKSASIGVGIGYFGVQPIGQVSCDQAAYATPDVAVTLDHQRVIDSLDARQPIGETPTAAAINGACQYANGYRRQTPGHSVVILLVTDGIPEAPASCASGGCCPMLADAVQAAANCAEDGRGVRTYVLGVGPELDNLNQIAAAGQTDSAYLVGNQDVTAQVLSALDSIRGAAIPCDLDIPQGNSGQKLDYSQVNVLVGNQDCSVPLSPIYYVTEEAQCDATSGGWYYDDPNAPTTVKLCSATCAAVSQPNATLRFSIGCQSLPPPVR
jgi:Mg-chelatase subunit ChlD